MIEIVTVAEAKLFTRVDHDEEDSTIQMLIDAATEAALATADAWDREGEPPARLKLAVLVHVARAFDNRDAADAPEGNAGLLWPLRTVSI